MATSKRGLRRHDSSIWVYANVETTQMLHGILEQKKDTKTGIEVKEI